MATPHTFTDALLVGRVASVGALPNGPSGGYLRYAEACVWNCNVSSSGVTGCSSGFGELIAKTVAPWAGASDIRQHARYRRTQSGSGASLDGVGSQRGGRPSASSSSTSPATTRSARPSSTFGPPTTTSTSSSTTLWRELRAAQWTLSDIPRTAALLDGTLLPVRCASTKPSCLRCAREKRD